MKKNTTVYINNNNLNQIDDAAKTSRLKRIDIIIKLFELAIRDNKKLENNRASVEYQKSNPNVRWKTTHVCLPEDIAFFCLDMRRFYCKSVSFILAHSVVNFMEDLINKLLGINCNNTNADNYPLNNSNFERNVLENEICWLKYWKLPPAT